MPKRKLSFKTKNKIRTISLIPTKTCNLSCTYCYEKSGQIDDQIMDIEIAKESISRYMKDDDGFDKVVIDIFGGEPLLAFLFIKELFDWMNNQTWPKDFHFSICTNGTLLNDDIKAWALKNKSRLTFTFSINGNKTAHDLSRDYSYDRLLPHIPFFMEHWPRQPAKMTICAENLQYVADSIIALEEMGLFFTANVAFENFWGDPQEQKLLDLYNDQLMQLVDYYSGHPELYPVYRILDSVPLLLGDPEKNGDSNKQPDCIRFCGAGHEMVAIDTDGKTYPCHRFLPWVSGRPGPEIPANTQPQWKNEECLNCKVLHSCPTCAGYNWELNDDTAIRTTFHCKAIKLEILASAKLAALKLKNHQMPELSSLPYSEQQKIKNHFEVLLKLINEGI